jgi:alkyl hydroperoxide reductase subunit AhpC
MTVRIGERAPAFTLQAYRRCEEDPVTITLEDFRGDWPLVFFYPADFMFVCPTELQTLAALEEQFHAAGASILAASTDSWVSHRAWVETDPRLLHALQTAELCPVDWAAGRAHIRNRGVMGLRELGSGVDARRVGAER